METCHFFDQLMIRCEPSERDPGSDDEFADDEGDDTWSPNLDTKETLNPKPQKSPKLTGSKALD